MEEHKHVEDKETMKSVKHSDHNSIKAETLPVIYKQWYTAISTLGFGMQPFGALYDFSVDTIYSWIVHCYYPQCTSNPVQEIRTAKCRLTTTKANMYLLEVESVLRFQSAM